MVTQLLSLLDGLMKVDGLVVIGVHTPEYAYEKLIGNVRRAVQE